MSPFEIIQKAVEEGFFIRLSLSPGRTLIRKLLTTKKDCYQITEQKGAQAFHRNVDKTTLLTWLKGTYFKQGQLFTKEADFHLFFPNKVIKNPPTSKSEQPHNRQKERLALHAEPDKQKQIEKFLHEVKAILNTFKGQEELSVVDFGCGKAYLTFALYEFLSANFKVSMAGIDLKAEVVKNCQRLAEEKGHKGLKFIHGSIKDFQTERVDLAIALHACDTATDIALQKALELNAKVILAAPCCQHEAYQQIDHPDLKPLLKHGILRERLASLLTDAARGAFLESAGYLVRIVEFIDPTHTPKNTLIRAIFTGQKKSPAPLESFKKAFHFSLERLENLE